MKIPARYVSRFVLVSLFCALTFVLCAGVRAATNDDDHGREAVERRQKIEIGRFYAGSGGAVPMTPMAISLYNDAVKFFEKNEFELAMS